MNILFALRPEIFSILVMVFLIIYDRYCARFRSVRNEFLIFALFCFAHCLLAFITEITVNLSTVPKAVNDVFHILFFLFSLLYSLFYLEYAIKQIITHGKLRKMICYVARALSAMAVIVMLLSPIEYIVGECTTYSAGIGPTICYALGFLFFIGADVFLITNRKKINDAITFLMLPLSFVTMGLLVMQILIPEFLYTAQALTLTAIGLFFVIENPVGKFKDEEFLNHSIIKSLAHTFEFIGYVDLRDYSYRELDSATGMIKASEHSNAREMLASMYSKEIGDERKDAVGTFFDLATVKERLCNQDWISQQFISSNGKWTEGFFIAANRDGSGKCTNLIWATRDINDFKTREIQYTEELSKAKEVAENASMAKTNFLFNMSHDIRTPMNAIMGFRDLLEKNQNDPEKRADYLQKIEESSTVLLSIINNVLEMSRIEKGAIEIDETVWSAEQFNDTLYSIFLEMMGQKKITFTRIIDVQHPYVYCDPIKLREIFLNILSNAYKYTNPGGTVVMHLEEIPSEREGFAMYRTTITDTGIGMSEEYLPHLFEEFTRENNTTEAKVEGTGLGMPIVKRLVEILNGTVEVFSEKGKGTKFVVTIPHKIADKSILVDHAGIELDPNLFKGKRILLAEDNELNAEIAEEIISDAGFIVERAEDGAVCVEMIKKETPGYYDLILMDIQMPNMNGYEATRAIRALEDPEKAGIKIVAMTANAFEEDKREAYRSGMNGHLAKPINVRELMRTLAGIMAPLNA